MQEQKTKILLVEDDPNLGILLKEYLEAKDFNVSLFSDGKMGLDNFKKYVYDLCILDVMMPVMDGITLAKEIRKNDGEIPIVFLTAKSMKEDTIDGFNAGADDYITKPFSMEELLLRIKAILKRSQKNTLTNSSQSEFSVGHYKFNYEQQLLSFKDKQQKLTTREAQLLKLLCINMHNILDRNFALKSIWGDDNYFNGRSMDVYITKLRKYFKEDASIEIINIHGKGFKLLIKS